MTSLALLALKFYDSIWLKESESEVVQSCPTLWEPMECSLPGFSVHEVFQARILKWVAFSFSRGSSQPRDQTLVSHIAGRCFTGLSHQGALNINRLESNGTKISDKIRPWSSISKWNDTPRGATSVPRHCQKTKEWVVAQILEISTPSQK